MRIQSALRRRAGALYRGYIEPRVALAVRGRPRLDVVPLRSFGEYRRVRQVTRDTHERWLRAQWLRETTNPHRLQGYCAPCRAWTHFSVEYDRCFEVMRRSVPHWRETLICPSCHLNNRMRLALHLFEDRLTPSPDAQIYLTEQTTPLYAQVSRKFRNVVGSELLSDGTPPGKTNAAGIRREDLTRLTFPDASMDFIVSLEVLEHVPDYRAALREATRVLRPGGSMLLTAPFHGGERNLVRARIAPDGQVEHLEAPEYHGDPLSSDGCLCFYHFGWELMDDLRAAGFSDIVGLMCWSRDLAYLGENQIQFVARL